MSRKSWTTHLVEYLKHHEYLLLIIFTFITLILYPFLEHTSSWPLTYHILLSLILLSWIWSTWDNTYLIWLTIWLWVSSLILNWADYRAGEASQFILIYLITTFCFFCVVIIKVISSIVNHKKVNEHIIFWSIAGYLMIWMAWAFLFAIIETLFPWSFEPAATLIGNIPSFLYYTFVSMLTIGYWDMVPIGSHAQVWSVILAIAGQLYLTILIWILIGKYVKSD